MRTLASEGIRAFVVERLTSLSLAWKSFPYRNPYERIFQNPFLMGVFFIIIGRGAQETSLYVYVESKLGLRQNCQPSSSFHHGGVSFQPLSEINFISFADLWFVRCC